MKERLEYLFLQYLESSATEKELEEFLSYVNKARNDRQLRDLIRAVYNSIRESDPGLVSYIDGSGSLFLNDLTDEEEDQPQQTINAQPRRKKNKSIVLTLSVVIILAGIAGLWLVRSKNTHSGKELVSIRSLTKKFTERAEFKFLLLPDSTQVWLNTNSSLEFPDEFSDKKREVYLTGEAYFDVRHAEELPFVIHTGKITTTVLGTAFNIKAYPYQREVLVAVSKGKVRVSRDDQPIAVLLNGQQIRIGNIDTSSRQKTIDTARIAYWQKGTLAYDDERIGDIALDLQQIYNVPVSFCDSSIVDTRITTSFNRNIGIDQALQVIARLVDKQVMIDDGKYIIR